MLNIFNNITLILGYSCYVVIAYMALVLMCSSIEKAIEKQRRAKAIKKRKKRIYDSFKTSIK